MAKPGSTVAPANIGVVAPRRGRSVPRAGFAVASLTLLRLHFHQASLALRCLAVADHVAVDDLLFGELHTGMCRFV